MEQETTTVANNNSSNIVIQKHERIIELCTLVLLGLATLATAYASWMGAIYSGNQTTYFMESNRAHSEGSTLYLEAVNNYSADWNTAKEITSLRVSYAIMDYNNDEIGKLDTVSELILKFDLFSNPVFSDLMGWDKDEAQKTDNRMDYAEAWVNETIHSSFHLDSKNTQHIIHEAYFSEAEEKLKEADELFELANTQGVHSDKYNMVTVVYATVLFLLGIVEIFKGIKKRYMIILISAIVFVITTGYVMLIPFI